MYGLVRTLTYFIVTGVLCKLVKQKVSNKLLCFFIWVIIAMLTFVAFDSIAMLFI